MNRSQRRKAKAAARHLDDGMRRAAGVPLDAPIIGVSTPWSRSDRDWFKAHSDRAHRVRAALPGETYARALADDEEVVVVIVRQIEPGWRVRSPLVIVSISEELVETIADLIARGFDEENAAHVLFDLTLTGRLVPLHEVAQMIAGYEAGTHGGRRARPC